MDPSEDTQTVFNLFSGSHHQTFQNPDFKVAGRDFIIPTFAPTINVNVSSPQGTTPSNCATNHGTRPHHAQTFASPVPPPTGRPPSVKNREHISLSQFLGSLRRLILRNKSNQVEISPLDGTSAQFPAFLTTPDNYVFHMLRSGKGLPCWQPRPWKPLTGESGTIPGDVGIYTAERGFKRLFNIWDDDEAVLRTGRRYSETDYELPERAVVVAESGLFEGDAVVHGASSETSWMDDGVGVKSFEFECRSSQGAILAITSATELQELADFTALREHIAQNAELLYRHANSICRIADTEALYVITGCIKSESWALAAFNDPTTSPADTLKLVKRQGINRRGIGEFVWTRRGTSEARVGKSEASGPCDQSLFLRGFKLDFSQKARSRMRATKPRTLTHGCKNVGATIGNGQRNASVSFGCSRVAGANVTNSSLEKHRFPAVEEYTSDSDNDEAYTTSPTREPRFGYDSPHPCDHINRYLLDITSTDFALSHDDDWLSLLGGLEGNQPRGHISISDEVATLDWEPVEGVGRNVG